MLFALVLVAAGIAPAAIKHKFLAIDEGLGNLLYVNEYDSTANWIVPINKAKPRDMQLIGNNRLLLGHGQGFVEYDLTTGQVKREWTTTDTGVTSVRRLPGGKTLVMGLDLDGSKGIVLLTLDSLNVKKKKIIYPGNYVRIMRQTAQGTYLFTCNDSLKEGDTTGKIIWKIYMPGRPPANMHSWKAVRLDNGNVFVSTGYGAYLAEFDKNGAIVRTIGAVPQPAGVNPYFYSLFQLFKNGNCVVANWQGHGVGHGGAGIELLEFDKTGALVWQWNKPAIISSLQGVLVLDSLNTGILCDDRNGIMTPLNVSKGFVPYYQSIPRQDFRVRMVNRSLEIAPSTAAPFTAEIFDCAGGLVAEIKGNGLCVVDLSKARHSGEMVLVRIKSARGIWAGKFVSLF
jgi:hypothetical protein